MLEKNKSNGMGQGVNRYVGLGMGIQEWSRQGMEQEESEEGRETKEVERVWQIGGCLVTLEKGSGRMVGIGRGLRERENTKF